MLVHTYMSYFYNSLSTKMKLKSIILAFLGDVYTYKNKNSFGFVCAEVFTRSCLQESTTISY